MSAILRQRLLILWTMLALPAAATGDDGAKLLAQMTTPNGIVNERALYAYQNEDYERDDRRLTLQSWLKTRLQEDVLGKTLTDMRASDPRFVAEAETAFHKDELEPELRRFFAESVLMFAMLRANRTEFLPRQLEFWRRAWARVDMRSFKSKATARRWSIELGRIYAMAAEAAGPWSQKELERADRYLEGPGQLTSSSFRKDLQRLGLDVVNSQPRLISERDNSQLTTFFGAWVIYGATAMYGAKKAMDLLNFDLLNYPPTFIVSVGGAAMLAIYTLRYLQKGPSTPVVNTTYSWLFRDGAKSCSALLDEAKP